MRIALPRPRTVRTERENMKRHLAQMASQITNMPFFWHGITHMCCACTGLLGRGTSFLPNCQPLTRPHSPHSCFRRGGISECPRIRCLIMQSATISWMTTQKKEKSLGLAQTTQDWVRYTVYIYPIGCFCRWPSASVLICWMYILTFPQRKVYFDHLIIHKTK